MSNPEIVEVNKDACVGCATCAVCAACAITPVSAPAVAVAVDGALALATML